jgi:hypothetical protein
MALLKNSERPVRFYARNMRDLWWGRIFCLMVARQTPQFNRITPRRAFLFQANVQRYDRACAASNARRILKRNILKGFIDET